VRLQQEAWKVIAYFVSSSFSLSNPHASETQDSNKLVQLQVNFGVVIC